MCGMPIEHFYHMSKIMQFTGSRHTGVQPVLCSESEALV